jgi:hypothetical protein
MEKRLNEQVEAPQAMNETLNKFIAIMGNQEAARNVAPSPQLVITPLQVSQPSRVKLGIPSNFDGDRVQEHAFLMSCELYILLTAPDFIDDVVNGVLLPSIALNCLPGCCTRMFNCSGILD